MKYSTKSYCFRSGHIGFTNKAHAPEGAIVLGTGSHTRKAVEICARWSYPTVRGGNDSAPLVPGIPEADTDEDAFQALCRFSKEIEKRTAK
jgi:hypothetical protein